MTLAALPPAFLLALRQLGDRRLLGILALALGIAVLVTGPFLLIVVGIAGLFDWVPWPAWLGGGGADGGEDGGSWVGWSSRLFWTYVMSPLAVAIIGALLEPIVEAVEARHYPGLTAVRRRGLGAVAGYALRFFGLMVGVSLLAWILSLALGLPGPIVFTLASGYLISREYFETVALRRLSAAQAKAAQRAALWPLWAAGCAVALFLNLPLVNLLAPLVGVAAFTHLYHAR